MNKVFTPSTVLMVKPWHFGFNKESAKSNSFQKNDVGATEATQLAIVEYENAIAFIRSFDIDVISFEEKTNHEIKDAVFPNNWIGLHPGGKVILYPMTHESRRLERNPKVLEQVESEGHSITNKIDLSQHERDGKFLEGTGSMVIDYKHRIAYACLSPRTDLSLFEETCKILKLDPVSFHAKDFKGQAIYHTNVMMAITEKVAIVCLECIDNFMERTMLKQELKTGGLEIMTISQNQMNSFCGNVFEVKNKAGKSFLICSETAWNAFNPTQQELIKKYHSPIAIAIPTIETLGGGSARCMVAGVYF